MQDGDRMDWDRFASSHSNACLFQLSAWRDTITRSYSHEGKYIFASRSHTDLRGSPALDQEGSTADSKLTPGTVVVGILPLVHMRHWLFGNSLVSIPFCDAGGVLAEDAKVEWMLVEHSLVMAEALQVPVVELRQYQPLTCVDIKDLKSEASPFRKKIMRSAGRWRVTTATKGNKVRMLMDLPGDPDWLMRSFKAKLRSQIRKPMKEGLNAKVGGVDLIEDFYDVFAANMRDLGSPVHAKRFIFQVLLNFRDRARIFVVYKKGVPMACSLTLGFNRVLSNPWASSLRRYSQIAPNMLLYWSMLQYACQHGYSTFDFGRSTVDEGTYRFKTQWGAKPSPLYWYRFVRDGHSTSTTNAEGKIMRLAETCWKHLPLPMTRILGPWIRRHISL
jgi:serine/alanine adding enzyme